LNILVKLKLFEHTCQTGSIYIIGQTEIIYIIGQTEII